MIPESAEPSSPPPTGKAQPASLFGDIFRKDHPRTLKRDLWDLYDFYIDEDTRTRLSGMGRIKRGLFLLGWLLKGLFLKLTPARRLLLLLCFYFFVVGDFAFRGETFQVSFHMSVLSFAILLFILMLELKDKLLARDELAVGRAVQLALMPAGSPEIPGWDVWLYSRPANDVGGDLVDYVPLGEGRSGLALGDVAGKGLGAALLMAKLQATLRTLASESESLGALGARLNRILCRDGVPGRFATLVYLEVVPGSWEIRLLNAGHPPPLVVRPDRIDKLPSIAMPLGFLPDAAYRVQTLPVGAGDLVVVFSDGLTEAWNPQEEFFGDDRLLDLLPGLRGLTAAKAGERILEEVTRFVGDQRNRDDLSLILIRRLPEKG